MKTQIFKISELTSPQITQLATALNQGALAVFATDTVYGIGTGAFCESSVQKIYALKKRPLSQPLQLLVASLAQAQQVAQFSAEVQQVATTYWPGGLTLILPPSSTGTALLRGSNGLGIRVPACPILQRVLAQMSMPLSSTSANLHGQPVLTDEKTVLHTFNGLVEYMVLGGSLTPIASSVLDCLQDPPRLLREGTILKQSLQITMGKEIL